MENIGDWLYIIILIIAGISSVISSFKKQKQKNEQPREIIVGDGDTPHHPQPQTARPQTQSQAPGWPQMQPSPRPQPQTRAGMSNTTSNRANEYNDFKRKQQTEGISALAQSRGADMMPDSLEETYTPVTLEDLPANTDEWRKAFVYAEIFNRKY